MPEKGGQEKFLAEQDTNKPTQVERDQLELELGIPRTLRTEFNFLKFPFFDLARDSKRPKIKIEEQVETKEGTFHILWLVTRDIEGQFPGDFEKHLHRAIEQVINAMPKPITNPLRLGSLRYIARLMGINESGKNLAAIQRAFENIVSATIKANGTFQLKESKSKRYIKDTFHLYDRVIFKGEELPDNNLADCVYLVVGSWYLNNINNNYVVPLDWRFYNCLTGSITTRMYEFLCIHFFTALERGRDYHDMQYSQICDYFPLTRQYPAWKARKQLKHAHESLTNTGYFNRIEWHKTSQRDDWVIRYWIGDRAREEYEHNKQEIRQLGEAIQRPVPIPQRRRRKVEPQGSSNGLYLVKMLTDGGLSYKVAEKLSGGHSEAYVVHKIEVFDWLVGTKSHLIKENPAGFLRKSIEEGYVDPQGFVSKEERELKAKQAEEYKKRQERQRKIEDYRAELKTTPKQKAYGFLISWEAGYKKQHGHPPTVEEKNEKQKELIKELPSLEERQQQIFGKILFKATTVEEFEKELAGLAKQRVGKRSGVGGG